MLVRITIIFNTLVIEISTCITTGLPEEEVQPRLSTLDTVQHDTDQIIKQQPLNQDQPDAIDNTRSCIAEKELDRVSTVIEVRP